MNKLILQPRPLLFLFIMFLCLLSPLQAYAVLICPLGYIYDPGTNRCLPVTGFSGTLGSKNNGLASTDILVVECNQGTVNLSASVIDKAPDHPSLVTIQLVKGVKASALSYDTQDANGLWSSEVNLSGGAGSYLILISKTVAFPVPAIGQESYGGSYICKSASGSRVPNTVPVTIQDQ